jgi:DNA-binding CsgD family transcriptional regulator
MREDVLLERESELARLRSEMERARAGAGRVVAVEGPPGIGKTRLVGEARRLARELGLAPLHASGAVLERGFPYGVVRQLLEPALRERGAELLSGPALPARALLDPAAPAAWQADEQSFRLLHGLLWLVIDLAEREPLLLTVDDAHWADGPSLRFLSYLARRLEGLPVLLVMAYRSDGEPPLRRAEHSTLLPGPLSVAATDTLLTTFFGERVDAEFSRECHRSAGGNPQLLRELARALEARGVAPASDGLPALREVAAGTVARTVRDRLGDSPPEAARLAEAIAVLGSQCDLTQAAAVADIDADGAERAAAELRRLGIVRPEPGVELAHPLLRDALLDGVDPSLRERAVAVLVRSGAPAAAVAEGLLELEPANDQGRVRLLRDAARESLAAGDSAPAAAYLHRALAEPPAPAERADLLLELASAEERVDYDAAIARLEEALPLIGDPRRRAQTGARLAAMLPSQRPADAIAVALRAIDDLGDADAGLRRVLLAVVASGATLLPEPGALPDGLADALEAGADAGDAGARMLRSVLAYRAAWRCDAATEVVAAGEPAFDGAWQDTLEVTGGPLSFGMLALLAADSPAVARIADEWLRRSRELGSLPRIGGSLMLRAHVALAHGQLADAAQDGEDALEAMDLWGMEGAAVAHAAAALAEAQLELGDREAAAAALARARCRDRDAGTVGLHGPLACRARLRAAGGDLRGALRDTLDLGRRFEELGGRNPALLPWRSRAALLQHALGEDGGELAAAEVEAARAWGTPRAIGRALAAHGSVTGSLPALEEAVAVLDGSPAPLELAAARLALGAAIHRDGRPAAAREPLRAAVELAAQCGARPLEERARAALVEAGARPRRTAQTGPAALSAGERQVAELAVQGLTNRELAEALYLTPGTIEKRLSSAYRKLGIGSRAQLGAALGERR